MASEAINKIKEAEKTANEIIEKAMTNSKEIIKQAEIKAEDQYKEILQNTAVKIKEIKDNALIEGGTKAEPIAKMGQDEINKITSTPEDRIDLAVNFVIERIVKFNGNS